MVGSQLLRVTHLRAQGAGVQATPQAEMQHGSWKPSQRAQQDASSTCSAVPLFHRGCPGALALVSPRGSTPQAGSPHLSLPRQVSVLLSEG